MNGLFLSCSMLPFFCSPPGAALYPLTPNADYLLYYLSVSSLWRLEGPLCIPEHRESKHLPACSAQQEDQKRRGPSPNILPNIFPTRKSWPRCESAVGS
jgi:hypothetical protein